MDFLSSFVSFIELSLRIPTLALNYKYQCAYNVFDHNGFLGDFIVSLNKESDLIKKRSEIMLQESRAELTKKNFDLAILLGEQALQLRLKSSILKKTGSMPRIHPIRELLNLFGDSFPQKNAVIHAFIKQNRALLIRLEEAYLGARYIYRIYDEVDANDLVTLAEQAVDFIANCEK